MRNVNRSSALFESPPNAAFTSFFRINSSRDASFVRPPSRYAVRVFWTWLIMWLTSWPLRRLGRPLGLPETPFLNLDLLIAWTPGKRLIDERSGVFATESKQGVQPVTPPTHSTGRRHPLTGDSQCGSHNRRNCHHLSLSQNWCGRCGPFSSRLSIRLIPLTGHPRQKRRWQNEFCGPHQMESRTQ